MTRGVRRFFVGSLVLVALAGCGRSILQYAEREPWRREAEATCLKSGAVREKPGLVRIEPIEGPGICGAEFPLKVASLGDLSGAMGFAEAVRPPGSIPRGGSQIMPQPRWPIAQQHAAPAVTQQQLPPPEPYMTQSAPRYAPPQQAGSPMSLSPPGVDYVRAPQTVAPMQEPPPAYGPPQAQQNSPGYTVVPTRRTGAMPANMDDGFRVAPAPRAPSPQHQAEPLPALGPQRAPLTTASVTPIEIKPTATLACPIVSALDRWMAQAVQPAAHKWFRQPVVEIRQISAYSCRGMNGQVGARISEHAFGNALDIAAFVLADGKRITIKNGWNGSPEEQGFLRDVQAAACDTFTTVLAPGSNRFHYDHFHVDLMRRASGRRVCNPRAEDGEMVAARARGGSMYAGRKDPRPPTRRSSEPLDPREDPYSVSSRRNADPIATGSIGSRRHSARPQPADDDDDWVEDDGPRPAIDWGRDKHKVH